MPKTGLLAGFFTMAFVSVAAAQPAQPTAAAPTLAQQLGNGYEIKGVIQGGAVQGGNGCTSQSILIQRQNSAQVCFVPMTFTGGTCVVYTSALSSAPCYPLTAN